MAAVPKTPVDKIRVSLTTNAQQPKTQMGSLFCSSVVGSLESTRPTMAISSQARRTWLRSAKARLPWTRPSTTPQKPYGTAEPLIEDLDKYPVWLRFDPVDGKDNWHLDRALVEVFAKGDPSNKPTKKYEILSGSADKKLVLGKLYGLYVSLGPWITVPTGTSTTTSPKPPV